MVTKNTPFYADPVGTPIGRWILTLLFLLLCVAVLLLYCKTKSRPLSIIDRDQQYATDGRFVYHSDDVVWGADPRSFVILSYSYARDDRHVYTSGKQVTGADSQSFIPLDDYYAKDNKHVFYNGMTVQGANPAVFVILDNFYTKDSTQVYYNGTHLIDADPQTFTTSDYYKNGYDAKDKTHYYNTGQSITLAEAAANLHPVSTQ